MKEEREQNVMIGGLGEPPHTELVKIKEGFQGRQDEPDKEISPTEVQNRSFAVNSHCSISLCIPLIGKTGNNAKKTTGHYHKL